MPDEVLARFGRPGPFVVLPEAWPALELFLRVNTQWRMQPMGGPVDLDYTAVDVCCRRLGLEPEPRTWEGLMLLGRAAARKLGSKDR